MRVLKWGVPVDDAVHTIGSGKVLHVGVGYDVRLVHVWTEESTDPGLVDMERRVQVFGTGQSLPPRARHLGTAVVGGLVWHLYDVTEDA